PVAIGDVDAYRVELVAERAGALHEFPLALPGVRRHRAPAATEEDPEESRADREPRRSAILREPTHRGEGETVRAEHHVVAGPDEIGLRMDLGQESIEVGHITLSRRSGMRRRDAITRARWTDSSSGSARRIRSSTRSRS